MVERNRNLNLLKYSSKKLRRVKLHKFWEEERNLFILLIFLSVHMFLIVPIGQDVLVTRILALLFYSFILIAAWRYLENNTRFGRVLIVGTFSIIVLLAVGTFMQRPWVSVVSDFSIVLYCGVLAWIVLMKTFSEGPITIYRIQGSIVVYLLIGLIFANTYQLAFHFYPNHSFKGLSSADGKEFQYFSFVTLTTVGYGDITPGIPLTRSMANIESLLGQLYPAILIARLVSMEFAQRK
jgi:hypothetical protein